MIALSYLHLYRPSLEPFRPEQLKEPIEDQKWKCFESQKWFLALSLTPTVLSVLLLTTTWAWFRNAGGTLNQLALGGLASRETFIMGAVMIHMLSWLFSALLLRRFKQLSRWLFVEMLAIAGTGALGGFFLWSVLAVMPSEMPVSSFAEWYACFGVPGILAMFLLTATLFVGIASRYTDDDDREWWGRSGSWVLTGRSRMGRDRDVGDVRARPSGLHACRDHLTGRILWCDRPCTWVQLADRCHHGPKEQAIDESGRLRGQSGNPCLYCVLAYIAGTRDELAPEGPGPPARSFSS